MEKPPQDITTLLRLANENPSSQFAEELKTRLFELVKERLRAMAGALLRNENAGHVLQATCLVDDAFIGLLHRSPKIWENRDHLYAAAFLRMKHQLINQSRNDRRAKRDPGKPITSIDNDAAAFTSSTDDPAALAAMQEILKKFELAHPIPFSVFALRILGSYQQKEVASELGMTIQTVKRHVAFAIAYLQSEFGWSD